MSSLLVTMKGQITLKRDLLQFLGIKPGERVEIDKLPGGELRIRAAQPTGTIDDFLRALDGKVHLPRPLTIEDMDEISAQGWSGLPDGEK